MPEQDKPFVVNDRRKFRADGELKEPLVKTVADASATPVESASADQEKRSKEPIPFSSAHLVTPPPEEPVASLSEETVDNEPPLPPPPTESEIAQVRAAYDQTAERLDTMVRATNPGAEHLPPMDFSRVVQSIYMSAMMQLGAGTPQGQEARVDLLGAKQSIDMLGVVGEKSEGNLDANELKLLQSALFELRMGFLEITQLLARQAAAKQAPPATGAGAAAGFSKGGFTGAGPRIVS